MTHHDESLPSADGGSLQLWCKNGHDWSHLESFMRYPMQDYVAFATFATENCNCKDGHYLTVVTSNPLGPHSYNSEDYVCSITMFMRDTTNTSHDIHKCRKVHDICDIHDMVFFSQSNQTSQEIRLQFVTRNWTTVVATCYDI